MKYCSAIETSTPTHGNLRAWPCYRKVAAPNTGKKWKIEYSNGMLSYVGLHLGNEPLLTGKCVLLTWELTWTKL